MMQAILLAVTFLFGTLFGAVCTYCAMMDKDYGEDDWR